MCCWGRSLPGPKQQCLQYSHGSRRRLSADSAALSLGSQRAESCPARPVSFSLNFNLCSSTDIPADRGDTWFCIFLCVTTAPVPIRVGGPWGGWRIGGLNLEPGPVSCAERKVLLPRLGVRQGSPSPTVGEPRDPSELFMDENQQPNTLELMERVHPACVAWTEPGRRGWPRLSGRDGFELGLCRAGGGGGGPLLPVEGSDLAGALHV